MSQVPRAAGASASQVLEPRGRSVRHPASALSRPPVRGPVASWYPCAAPGGAASDTQRKPPDVFHAAGSLKWHGKSSHASTTMAWIHALLVVVALAAPGTPSAFPSGPQRVCVCGTRTGGPRPFRSVPRPELRSAVFSDCLGSPDGSSVGVLEPLAAARYSNVSFFFFLNLFLDGDSWRCGAYKRLL